VQHDGVVRDPITPQDARTHPFFDGYYNRTTDGKLFSGPPYDGVRDSEDYVAEVTTNQERN